MIKIDTSIFGHNGVTRDSAISPYLSASPRVVKRLPSQEWRHSDLNLGINSYNNTSYIKFVNQSGGLMIKLSGSFYDMSLCVKRGDFIECTIP